MCQNRNFLSNYHPDHIEGSEYIYFMPSDSSLRSELHDIMIAMFHFDTLSYK